MQNKVADTNKASIDAIKAAQPTYATKTELAAVTALTNDNKNAIATAVAE